MRQSSNFVSLYKITEVYYSTLTKFGGRGECLKRSFEKYTIIQYSSSIGTTINETRKRSNNLYYANESNCSNHRPL
ncbi:hypothetical protein Trisim1_001305 [Trichoderma cf. simile WF8]